MRTLRRLVATLAVAVAASVLLLALYAGVRGRPQDLPWTPLDLAQPVGLFTGRKLTGLGEDFPRCRALLDRAGVRYTALPPRRDGQCGYTDAVRFTTGGAGAIAFAPAGLGIACPVAAALALWEWEVVQPAAQRLYGSRVVAIEHFGSYSCRRIAGGRTSGWSEHATADAVDIAGFRLADGTRITVARDWGEPDRRERNPGRRAGRGQAEAGRFDAGDASRAARFLHAVRDGACSLFATTLSPDYNVAHRDHLHLDQAARGATGWRACR